MQSRCLYLDYAATAPLRESVRNRVLATLDVFGNPSSLHRIGIDAEDELSRARKDLAQAMHVPKGYGQLIFTGGGTEANNLAIFGLAQVLARRGRHAVTTAIEHPAVRECFRRLEAMGWTVTYVRPQASGDITLSDIMDAIQEDTTLLSLMHVNNETGAILPIREVTQALQSHPKVRIHVDGTQALGKIPVSMKELAVDVYTVSAHKVGGLKGTGALFVREGVRLEPHVVGGGQEFGLRSGTENVLGAVAFAAAAKEAVVEMTADVDRALGRYDDFCRSIAAIPGWQLFIPHTHSPYILYGALTGLKGEVVVHALESEGLFVSSGSACSTAHGKQAISHVLDAMQVQSTVAQASVRFSWAPSTSGEMLAEAIQIVERQTAWLRQMMRR